MKLPLNGSQIHSLEYQRGERDDKWPHMLAQPISIDPEAFVDPVQRALDNILEVEAYARSLYLWIRTGQRVLRGSPDDSLPNIPYARDKPFDSGKLWAQRDWIGYRDLQDDSLAAAGVRRSQLISLKLGWNRKKGHHFQVLDELDVDGGILRDRESWQGQSLRLSLGRMTSTHVRFGLTETGDASEVTDLDVTVHAPGGIDGAQQYAEQIFERTLFEPSQMRTVGPEREIQWLDGALC